MTQNCSDNGVVVGIVAGLVFMGGVAIGVALHDDSPAETEPNKSEVLSQKLR